MLVQRQLTKRFLIMLEQLERRSSRTNAREETREVPAKSRSGGMETKPKRPAALAARHTTGRSRGRRLVASGGRRRR